MRDHFKLWSACIAELFDDRTSESSESIPLLLVQIAALEVSRAHLRANKFVPVPVNLNKVDNSPLGISPSQPSPGAAPGVPPGAVDTSLSYPQYLSTVRSQMMCVTELRKMLMDFAKGLTP